MKGFIDIRHIVFWAFVAFSLHSVDKHVAMGAEAKLNQPSKWDEIIAAAQREGTLSVYGNTGYEPIFVEFEREFPGIKVVHFTGRGSSGIVPRVLNEQRAGKYLGDIYLAGVGGMEVLLQASALDPLASILILPEVIDKSKWWNRQHRYLDSQEEYVIVFNGPFRVDVIYNRNLVNPKDLRSYWDLLDRKWPQKPGMFSNVSAPHKFFHYNPALGPRFLNRLFGELDVKLSSSMHQLTDWLGSGAISFAIAASAHSEVRKAQTQGLPIGLFNPNHFLEGASLTSGTGAVGLLKQAPHFNASRLAINWLLSRKGQIAFQKNFLDADSFRVDIPKDAIPNEFRRIDGIKYLEVDRLDFSPKPIRALMLKYGANHTQ